MSNPRANNNPTVTFIDSNGTVHHYYALGGHGGVSNSSWGRGVEGTAVHNYYGRGNGPGGSRVISTSGPLFGPGVVHHHYEAGEGNGAARGHGVGSFDRGGHLRSESVNGNDAGRGGGSGGNRLDSRRPHRRGRMRNRNAPSAIAEEKSGPFASTMRETKPWYQTLPEQLAQPLPRR